MSFSPQYIYKYSDYKAYINDAIRARPRQGWGLRSDLARAIKCQTAYVSQVLAGHAHFNLEQGQALNRYFRHAQAEAHFFLLLIQLARAGTAELRAYFSSQIQAVLDGRQDLKTRFAVKRGLGLEDQLTYYSAWYYSAVHIAISVPKLRSPEALVKELGLPLLRVMDVLEFLISSGLATREGDHYSVGTTEIHLGADSPMISKHHTNWRMKAIQAMENTSREDLHYSSVITLSREDAVKIRERWVRELEESHKVIRQSKDEVVYSLAMDFFEI